MKKNKINPQLLISSLIFLSGLLMSQGNDIISESKIYSETTDLLETWIESIMDYDRIPGVSIAVVHDQEIVYAKGFGYADLKNSIKATPDTYYGIGSISKQFTALAIMQLRDKGKLNLLDPVSKYLTWFDPDIDDPSTPQPTIQDLLRHSSGLPCEPDQIVWQNQTESFPSRKELIERVKNIKLSYPTNTEHNYSNTGYALLGEIVSVVSNMEFDDYIQKNILDPIGLRNTVPNSYVKSFKNKAATGYSIQQRYGNRVELPIIDSKSMTPAFGIGSTAKDLAKYLMWQFSVLDDKNTNILKQETLREMQAFHWENPKWGYGFQYWYLDDLDIIGHQGSIAGYQAQILLNTKEKIGVIFISNGKDAPKWRVAMETYDIFSQSYHRLVNEDVDKNIGIWEKYTGYYTSEDTWADAEVVEWEGDLYIMWLPPWRLLSSLTKLQHIEGNVFREVRNDGELGKHYIFALNDNDQGIAMKFNSNILKKVINRNN